MAIQRWIPNRFYGSTKEDCWDQYLKTGHWATDMDDEKWVVDQYDEFFHAYYTDREWYEFNDKHFLEEFMDYLDDSQEASKYKKECSVEKL